MKVFFGFHVVLGMTSEVRSYVDVNEMAGLYQALGSGMLGDGELVKEKIRSIVHLYFSFTQTKLWMLSKQNRGGKSKIDCYRLAAWYNLFNGVHPGRESRYHVPEIERTLDTTKYLDEVFRLVQSERLIFERNPAAIPLQSHYVRSVLESKARGAGNRTPFQHLKNLFDVLTLSQICEVLQQNDMAGFLQANIGFWILLVRYLVGKVNMEPRRQFPKDLNESLLFIRDTFTLEIGNLNIDGNPLEILSLPFMPKQRSVSFSFRFCISLGTRSFLSQIGNGQVGNKEMGGSQGGRERVDDEGLCSTMPGRRT